MRMDHEQLKLYDINSRVRKKLVVVGDGATGKTALLMVQSNQPFPEKYVPTIFESYISRIPVKKQLVELNLWDTAGQEEYDRLRPLSYPDTDIVLICFSIDKPSTFYNVTERWYPETRHFLPNVPVILVGTMSDLKPDLQDGDSTLEDGSLADLSRTYITTAQGMTSAKMIGAVHYFECSAKTGQGVTELFQKAASVSLKKGRRRQGECLLL